MKLWEECRVYHLILIWVIFVASPDFSFFSSWAAFADTLQYNQDATFGKEMFNNVCPVNLQWENKLNNAVFSSFCRFCVREHYVQYENTRVQIAYQKKGGGYCTGPWPDGEQRAALPAELWDEDRGTQHGHRRWHRHGYGTAAHCQGSCWGCKFAVCAVLQG